MMILTNAILDVNDKYTIHCVQLSSVQRLFRCDQCQFQPNVNDFQSYTISNQRAALLHSSNRNVLVSIIANMANDMIVGPS